MSKAVSALQGEKHAGFVEVAEAGLRGMVTLRGDLGASKVKKAVKAVTGLPVPAQRRIEIADGKAVAWMSPDELLLMVPYGDAPATVEALQQALAGEHHLVADVSDARAVFTIRGEKAHQVLMKLCPVDMERFEEGEIRRTRAAQVAAAFWKSGPEEFTLVSFRSVAAYVMGLLEVSSRPGSELFE
ncbi:sarcosine oxidase subunit gamma [Albidovulum inexpectatum]|uniref:Sarcosine oxidase subunit gamma n=1 Tax=Albidovulum inexpectatum TaxID=196587 RepID=A0A2S5JK13_9RHOB|nr:sarcosine oxidase subunit gamma family protein [Albidovulum inexpectatum]PPB81595.1 sarcosine oxidase subunit gamma [Albidovulum inexpectatum]